MLMRAYFDHLSRVRSKIETNRNLSESQRARRLAKNNAKLEKLRTFSDKVKDTPTFDAVHEKSGDIAVGLKLVRVCLTISAQDCDSGVFICAIASYFGFKFHPRYPLFTRSFPFNYRDLPYFRQWILVNLLAVDPNSKPTLLTGFSEDQNAFMYSDDPEFENFYGLHSDSKKSDTSSFSGADSDDSLSSDDPLSSDSNDSSSSDEAESSSSDGSSNVEEESFVGQDNARRLRGSSEESPTASSHSEDESVDPWYEEWYKRPYEERERIYKAEKAQRAKDEAYLTRLTRLKIPAAAVVKPGKPAPTVAASEQPIDVTRLNKDAAKLQKGKKDFIIRTFNSKPGKPVLTEEDLTNETKVRALDNPTRIELRQLVDKALVAYWMEPSVATKEDKAAICAIIRETQGDLGQLLHSFNRSIGGAAKELYGRLTTDTLRKLAHNYPV